MATFRERAAYSVNHVFFLLCLFIALVVSNFDFEGRTLLLTVSVPGHCLALTFCNTGVTTAAAIP